MKKTGTYEKTGRREGIASWLPGFFGRRSGGIPARLAAKDALRDVKKKFLSFLLRRVRHIGMCQHSEQALHPSLSVR